MGIIADSLKNKERELQAYFIFSMDWLLQSVKSSKSCISSSSAVIM